MPEVVNPDTGELAEVTGAEATSALLSGRANLRAGRPVVVRGDDGSLFELDPEDVGQALQDGFVVAEYEEVREARLQQEHGGLGGQAMTVAEEIGGMVTGPGSAMLNEALGGRGASERTLERAEANPGSAMLGKGLGVLLPALATGGTSLGAQGVRAAAAPASAALRAGLAAERVVGGAAAKALGTGVLGRAASTGAGLAAGGAVEGALFGAAQVARDDFLNDTEITAERLALGAGQGAAAGALFGGVLGAGGSLAASGGKSLVKRLSDGKTLREFLGGVADERAGKALLGTTNKRLVREADKFHSSAPGKKDGLSQVGRAVLDDMGPDQFMRSTAFEQLEHVQRRIAEEGASIGNTAKVATRTADDLKVALPTGRQVLTRIRKDVVSKLDDNPSSRQTARDLERRLSDEIEHLSHDNPIDIDDLWSVRVGLDKYKAKWDQVTAPAVLDSVRDVRNVLEDVVEESIEKVSKAGGEDLFGRYTGNKANFSKMKMAEKLLESNTTSQSSNRALSMSDNQMMQIAGIGEAIAGGGVDAGTLAVSLMAGLGNKLLRQRGAAFTAGTIDKLGRRYRSKALLDATKGEEVVESTAKSFLKSLSEGAKKTAKAAKTTAVVTGATTAAAKYSKVAQGVSELNQPDSPGSQRFRQEVAAVREENPQLADSMVAQRQRKADFLASKTRTTKNDPGERGQFGHLRAPRQSPRELRKLMRYVEAADNPRAVMDRLADGNIQRQDVETLQAVYPRLYRRLVDRVMLDLATMDKPPPNRKRRRLGILLDAPTDPALEPAFILRTQEALNQAKQAPQGPDGEQVLAPSRRTPPEVADMHMTRSDRILGGT